MAMPNLVGTRRHVAIFGAVALTLTLVAMAARYGSKHSDRPPGEVGPVDAQSMQGVTALDLLSAPVPESCGHAAGTLVNGELPGVPENQGIMKLAWLDEPATRQAELLAIGDLNGDGHSDAATVLYCTAGGVSWPEIVAFYSAGPTLLGFVSLDTVNLAGRDPGQNAFVKDVRYRNGAVEVRWRTQQDDDIAAYGTLAYSATFRWNGKRIAVENLKATTELPTASGFVSALRSGNLAAARRFAVPGVADEAADLFRSHPEALAAPPHCTGIIDINLPESVSQYVAAGGPAYIPGTARLCLLKAAPDARYVVLGMVETGYAQWQVGWIRVAS